MNAKETLWSQQNAALRHPSDIFGAPFADAGITNNTLKFTASPSFIKLLHKLKVTLVASREYENLLIALNAPTSAKLEQSFFHLPHPSGIAVDHINNDMYVAATRNPNQVIKFRVTGDSLKRLKIKKQEAGYLLPAIAKYYPGEYYFHDLAFGNGKLYANSVGMNSIIEIDLTGDKPEAPVWWPKCIEKAGKPDTSANYIQLNSIALGDSIESSFFSASGAKRSARRPGHVNYPVDGKGVIFSGATREPVGFGLTRPHAARLHNGRVWVANSGYGEVGYFENTVFKPIIKFNGWTRGLCFIGDILFVGISRVLPRFRQYAPGITSTSQECAISAIDLKTGKEIGQVKFPCGNQLFAVDYLSSPSCTGFPFRNVQNSDAEKKIFSVSLV